MYNTIFLDMDGVLADFDAKIVELLGVKLGSFSTSAAGWDAIAPYKHELFSQLEPMPDAYELYDGVRELAYTNKMDVAVLTAIPKYGRMPYARIQKYEWIQDFFPEIGHRFNIGPYAEHKQLHCIPGDILIDDNLMNIEQWNSVGGFGIYHTSALDSLKQLEAILNAKGF